MQCVAHFGRQVRGGQRCLFSLLFGTVAGRKSVCVIAWPGPFDVEIDCVAAGYLSVHQPRRQDGADPISERGGSHVLSVV